MTGTIMDVDQRRQQINEAKELAHLSVIAIGVRELRGSSRGVAVMRHPPLSQLTT
jgi:hypothetical protein